VADNSLSTSDSPSTWLQNLWNEGSQARNTASEYAPGLGIAEGVARGGASGLTQAATSAAKLGANLGVFGSTANTSPTGIGSLASDVQNLGNIYTGLQQGGLTGYGSAALNAGALYTRLPSSVTGLTGSTAAGVGSGLNAAASGFGLYENLKAGNYIGAAGNAAQLYSSVSGLSTALGGSALPGAAAAGSYALPIALFAAQNAIFNKQSQMSPESMMAMTANNAKGIQNAVNQPYNQAGAPYLQGMSEQQVQQNAQNEVNLQNYLHTMYSQMSPGQLNNPGFESPALGNPGGAQAGQTNRQVRLS